MKLPSPSQMHSKLLHRGGMIPQDLLQPGNPYTLKPLGI